MKKNKQTHKQTSKQTNKQTNKHTNKQTNKQKQKQKISWSDRVRVRVCIKLGRGRGGIGVGIGKKKVTSLVKGTNGRQKTYEIFHVYCIFYSGFMCQTTVIFGITKDGSLVLNTVAS